jgi:SPX domain protein involved in polyphosphate accumulation
MAAITVFKRYEKKYLMDEAAMRRLLPTILEHMEPDKFCRGGQTYEICNLYFDTEGFDVIRESLAKPFYKEKLRLRSYGIPKSPEDMVFLEMKKKVNRVVTKRRAKLTLKQAERFFNEGEIPLGASYMTEQVLNEIGYYLSHKKVSPVMRISYNRMAFFDRENPEFRLTFDQDIHYLKGDVGFWNPSKGKPLMDGNFRLMEVKVADSFPLWFAELLSRENIHISSFSKYGVAYKSHLKEDVFNGKETIDILSRI